MDKISELSAAGFSDTEINDWVKSKSTQLISAGFSQQEVTQWLGAQPPAPNDGAIRKVFEDNIKKAATGPDGQQKPLTFGEAVEAGWGMSVTGLQLAGKVPEKQLTGNEQWYSRIANSAAQMVGDVPAMILGAAAGGGMGAETGPGAAITATAGAFAMPAALRATMVDAYTKGEFASFGDFFERASGILLETGKSWVTGAATGGAGVAAGAALKTATPMVKGVGQMGAEISAMVTVGKALEGQVPNVQDFADAGVLLLGMKGSMKAAGMGKTALMDVYKKTGVAPEQVIADAKGDPTIAQDIAAGKFPKAYEDQIDPMFKGTEQGNTFQSLQEAAKKRQAERASYSRQLSEMSPDELNAAYKEAVQHNDSVEIEAVKRFYGADAASQFEAMTRRAKDKWLDENATDQMQEFLNEKQVPEDLFSEFSTQAMNFDTESPELLGRSIAMDVKNIDDPNFFTTADGVRFKNAIKYAKEQGWDLNDVLAGMRQRGVEWAGNDAKELFPRLFKSMVEGENAPSISSSAKRVEFPAIIEGMSSGGATNTTTAIATGRQALETMAKNLGIEVRTVNDGRYYSSSEGHIAVPPEVAAKLPEGITDPDFVFAHELGHAILVTRRGVNFSRENQNGKFSKWSDAKLRREIPNWDQLIDASKEMRPEFWDRPELGQQDYVTRADEIVADAIASVLKGNRDISMLYPLMKMVGMKPEALGLAGGGGGKGPNGMPLPAEGPPEPGSLAEAQKTILEKVNIGGENVKKGMSLDQIYTAALDDLAPINRAVEAMANGREVPADENPYVQARLLRGVYGKAQQALELGTFDFKTLENNGKSLKQVLEPVKDDLDGLRAYAVASRAMELKDRHIVSGFDVDAAAKIIKESGSKFEPVMRELVEFQNRITAYLRDAGVLDKKAYETMLQFNNQYIPFYRIFENQMPDNGAGAGLKTRNPIKSIKGSGMDIVDPIESIIKNTYTYLTLADRNAVGKAFYELGLKADHPEEFFTKQPTALRPTTVTEAELGKFLREQGIDAFPTEALTVFRAVRQPLAADEIGFFNEGKWTVLKTAQEVADAFKATDAQSVGMLMQFLSAPAKLLRAGSTLSPDFMVRNFVRDQFSAFVNSKVGFVPIYDTLVGAAHLLKKDEVFQNWLKSGGANATLVALDRRYIQSEITKLTGQDQAGNFLDKTWNVAKTPVEWLRVTSELIENATRLGEFNRAGAEGKADILQAGLGSREVTLDFARVGANAKAMNMITAFFNSQVQGIDRSIRSIQENPAGAMAKIGVAITLPSVLLWAANHDDPRWKEIPGWQRDLFWIVMTKDNVYRIPKPFELGIVFGSSVERMLDAFKGEMDKRDIKEFLKTTAGGFVPNLIPTSVGPFVEQMTNYSFFSGHQLVPAFMADAKTGVLPEYRYTEYTSELTKALGHIVGTVPGVKDTSIASPIVIDNYLRAWTGGLGTYALQAADAGLRKAGVLPDPVMPEKTLADIPVVKAFVVRYPSAQAESIQRFREDYSESSQYVNTLKTLAKQGDFDAFMRVSQMDQFKLIKLDGIDKALSEQNQLIRMVYKNPDIAPDEKRQIIDATYYNMIQQTHMGNDMLKEVKSAFPK